MTFNLITKHLFTMGLIYQTVYVEIYREFACRSIYTRNMLVMGIPLHQKNVYILLILMFMYKTTNNCKPQLIDLKPYNLHGLLCIHTLIALGCHLFIFTAFFIYLFFYIVFMSDNFLFIHLLIHLFCNFFTDLTL